MEHSLRMVLLQPMLSWQRMRRMRQQRKLMRRMRI